MFLKYVSLLSCSVAYATPEYASTIAGDVSLIQTQQLLEVTASDRSIIEWSRFSIPADETVRFLQPSESATVLNRVIGQDISELFGTLQANGIVYLINPRGIVVGKEGLIDTAAFLASTLDCSNTSFLKGGELSLQGDSEAPLTHLGTIRAKSGDVLLIAHQVDQAGAISAPEGIVSLAASHEILLKPKAFPLLNIRPSPKAFGISMRGSIEALSASLQSDSLSLHALEYYEGIITLTQEGGKLLLSTEGGPIHIQEVAHVKAPAGEITIKIASQEGDQKPLYQLGTLDVSGERGGSIRIETPKMLHTGKLHADGLEHGGSISVATLEALIQTRMAKSTANGSTRGGSISLEAGYLFSSGSLEAKGAAGGSIHVLGPAITLAGAKLDAMGHKENGGTILVGAQEGTLFKGPTEKILISPSTKLQATGFLQNGTVSVTLLNEKRLVTGFGAPNINQYFQWALVDPNYGSGSGFGSSVAVLSGGNIAVTKPSDNFAATAAGAVYLYDGTSADLISTITGSTASDQIGSGGITSLTSNGNYAFQSSNWDNGAATGAGAVTWASGSTGVSGTVSSSNSLVGSTTNDTVGSTGISTLTNGNYVARSSAWNRVDGGAVTDVGAVTWGSGTTGVTGTVSVTNSLIGFTTNDAIGGTGVSTLTNGSYVVRSQYWDRFVGGVVSDVGAATWGSGTTGVTGTVSVVNSLIGSTASDLVSGTGISTLTNGNYVVRSLYWNRVDGGAVTDVGAATWGDGTTGVTGTVSVVNSLIGSTLNDQVSGTGITTLTNGNYVVRSRFWNRIDPGGGTVADVGAVTWGSGTTGITGTISVVNSLIGFTANDQISINGVTGLTNGNYVVQTSYWNRVDGGALTDAGAATWGNGTTGITGTVSIINSLIGSTANDAVGYPGVCALTNGNYVVGSLYWDRVVGGAVSNVGAATWADGTTGITGTVSVINSLIGSASGNKVSGGPLFNLGIVALTNGNYVVGSAYWGSAPGVASSVGAATWGDGTTGITGTVSVINSLVGFTSSDQVTHAGILPLTNGSYVVASDLWDRFTGGALSQVGALTWGSGTTGITGTVSVVNSLIGSSSNDKIGFSGVTALTNGNYVAKNIYWTMIDPNGSTFFFAGAATWGSGTTGVTGTISVMNSLIGNNIVNQISSGGVVALSNGNYVVTSPKFDLRDPGASTVVDCGAATWGNGVTGVTGTVTQINSVVGPYASSSLQTPIEGVDIVNTFVCPFSGFVIVGGMTLPPVAYDAFIFAPTVSFNEPFPLWTKKGLDFPPLRERLFLTKPLTQDVY